MTSLKDAFGCLDEYNALFDNTAGDYEDQFDDMFTASGGNLGIRELSEELTRAFCAKLSYLNPEALREFLEAYLEQYLQRLRDQYVHRMCESDMRNEQIDAAATFELVMADLTDFIRRFSNDRLTNGNSGYQDTLFYRELVTVVSGSKDLESTRVVNTSKFQSGK